MGSASGAPSEFETVDVEPCAASEDGVTLRFKRVAGEPARGVKRVRYESEAGLDGWWRVQGEGAGAEDEGAVCALVEDSSEGTVRLLRGGSRGLRLVHEETGTVAREAYLVLSVGAEVE